MNTVHYIIAETHDHASQFSQFAGSLHGMNIVHYIIAETHDHASQFSQFSGSLHGMPR